MPQGAVLSPTLFNIYIDLLVQKIADANLQVLAFADDIVLIASGTIELIKTIRLVENWCRDFCIQMNTTKSAIMAIRADRRTKLPAYKEVRGIALVTHYKYLELEIDDCIDMRPLKEKLQTQLRLLKLKLSIQWAHKLPLNLRYTAWRQLMESKFSYALSIANSFSNNIKPRLLTFYYNSVKGLLSIKKTIRLETLLLFTLGMTGEDFVALKTKVMMNKINNIIDLQAQKDIDNAYQRLKLLATHETSYAIQLACNGLLNGRSNKHPLICPCGTIINDQHLTTC